MKNKFILIKEKIKLFEYAKNFVKLKNIGDQKFVGLCPFHNEKTASFHINANTDLYYCFGCGRGGDLISFYCEINHCDNKKALGDLCLMCGIKSDFKEVNNSLDKLLKLFLSQTEQLNFLQERGITLESIAKFKLGWSPSFEEIKSFLNQQKLDYAVYGFKTSFFKFFQNRVIFPIFDEYGFLVSFGGRCLDNRDGKYINGADSQYFHKHEILYGLNFVQAKSSVYLVEGYLDVIVMHQRGFSAVASMGTAVSKEQINLLWKHTDKIIVCFDGDKAGEAAAHKIALLALECIEIGKEMYFVFMPYGEDPASYLILHDTLNSLKEYALYEFFVEMIPIPENPDKKAFFFKKLLSYASKIKDSILRQEYRRRWNEFRWCKKRQNMQYDKIKFYDENDLLLLLFKYILQYNEILDHVAEDFLKLEMKSEYKENLILLLNGQIPRASFIAKVERMNITTLENDNFDNILEEWYKILNHVQYITSKERESRLLNNFSQEEWDRYKKWLEQKESKNE